MLKIVIQGNPTTKKNSQRIIYKCGRPMILPSKDYCDYEHAAGYQIHCKNARLEGPLEIKCLFYRNSKRRCDLTNLLEAVDDILVHYGVIKDDDFKVIASHDGSRVFVDKDNPRTEIYIKEYSDESLF